MLISKIFKIILLAILNLSVFIFCGIFMMGYDDSYEKNQSEYFNFSSMDIEYKLVWGFYNFWIILNCALLFFILFKVWKKYSKIIWNRK